MTDTISFMGEGNRIFIDIIAAPKRDGTGAILVLQDKTSHYRISEMREDFIANASHELKTPITIIKRFARRRAVGRPTSSAAYASSHCSTSSACFRQLRTCQHLP